MSNFRAGAPQRVRPGGPRTFQPWCSMAAGGGRAGAALGVGLVAMADCGGVGGAGEVEKGEREKGEGRRGELGTDSGVGGGKKGDREEGGGRREEVMRDRGVHQGHLRKGRGEQQRT